MVQRYTVERGKVFTWGKGLGGQLGIGDCYQSTEPVLVNYLQDLEIVDVACGMNHTAVISGKSTDLSHLW